jgi:hypothetical protein
MGRHIVVLTALVLLAMPASALAAYTGTVDVSQKTATLSGSGTVSLSTGGGVLHHAADLGPGFSSDTDFDSSAAGDQTVPDAGGWSVSVAGGGKDTFDVSEGEATNPVTFASGHTFFPGGVPCIVRDPVDRHGAILFSQHPTAETRFCYSSGVARVNVHAGTGNAEFTVLDTEKGVPLFFTGGPGGDDLSESANVPASTGDFHNAASDVHFTGGGGGDMLSFVDDMALAPATYRIGGGTFRKTGLPTIHLGDTIEVIVLYPQDGKSTIDIGRTGAQFVQLFGDFFGQKGPYRIDARESDAPIVGFASTGNDTIFGSALSDSMGTGGGNDTFSMRDSAPDSISCGGGTGKVTADTLDRLSNCPNAKVSAPLVGFLKLKFTSGKVKHGKRAGLDAVSTVAGRLTLTFRRGGKVRGTRTAKVKAGPNSLRVKTGKLPKGRYKVSARVRGSKGKPGPATTLHLRIT